MRTRKKKLADYGIGEERGTELLKKERRNLLHGNACEVLRHSRHLKKVCCSSAVFAVLKKACCLFRDFGGPKKFLAPGLGDWTNTMRGEHQMSRYNLSKYEQEVVINFNAGEDAADLYTANTALIRKMDKLVEQNPEQFRLIRVDKCPGEIVSKRYLFPKRFISIRSRDRESTMTEEQRQQASERMKQLKRTS